MSDEAGSGTPGDLAAATLQARLVQRQRALAILERRDALAAQARLLVFLAGVIGTAALSQGRWLWAVGCTLTFVALAVWHDTILRQASNGRLRVRVYEDALARQAQRYPTNACEGPQPPVDHPYARDLDLFGPQSLFGLLCTAKTSVGVETLTRWLLMPPHSAKAAPLQARQAAVRALRDALDLREDLAVCANAATFGMHAEDLRAWATAPAAPGPRGLMARLIGCHVLVLTGFLLWWFEVTRGGPLLVALVVQWVTLRPATSYVAQVMGALEAPRQELPLLADVMRRLLREKPDPELLQQALAALRQDNVEAPAAVARLGRIGQWYDARSNQLFAPVAWLLGWGPHWALRAERWRRRYGAALPQWLAAVGIWEALVSLGGYAFEQASDCFAEFIDADATAAPLFEAQGLAHPLLPPHSAVRNDVRIDASVRLLIVSGSNMSGKSTLLRAIGAAVVLAQCGAPARAQRLRLSPASLGATLRVQDSLQAGLSRFYAELRRLRGVRDLLGGPVPLLFLLDEILHGTNSHDRAIGSEAVLGMLLKGGGYGLVTTHDLSLSQKATSLGAKNVHFADDWQGEALHFDYRMRDGIVQHSNALALMRKEGLLG